ADLHARSRNVLWRRRLGFARNARFARSRIQRRRSAFGRAPNPRVDASILSLLVSRLLGLARIAQGRSLGRPGRAGPVRRWAFHAHHLGAGAVGRAVLHSSRAAADRAGRTRAGLRAVLSLPWSGGRRMVARPLAGLASRPLGVAGDEPRPKRGRLRPDGAALFERRHDLAALDSGPLGLALRDDGGRKAFQRRLVERIGLMVADRQDRVAAGRFHLAAPL